MPKREILCHRVSAVLTTASPGKPAEVTADVLANVNSLLKEHGLDLQLYLGPDCSSLDFDVTEPEDCP